MYRVYQNGIRLRDLCDDALLSSGWGADTFYTLAEAGAMCILWALPVTNEDASNWGFNVKVDTDYDLSTSDHKIIMRVEEI